MSSFSGEKYRHPIWKNEKANRIDFKTALHIKLEIQIEHGVNIAEYQGFLRSSYSIELMHVKGVL